MGAGRVLCDDVLLRRMCTCILSVSSTVSWSVDPGTTPQHFWCRDKNFKVAMDILPVKFGRTLDRIS